MKIFELFLKGFQIFNFYELLNKKQLHFFSFQETPFPLNSESYNQNRMNSKFTLVIALHYVYHKIMGTKND
jgi:hypothetical protein